MKRFFKIGCHGNNNINKVIKNNLKGLTALGKSFRKNIVVVPSKHYKGSIPNAVRRLQRIPHFTGLACTVTAGVVVVDTPI